MNDFSKAQRKLVAENQKLLDQLNDADSKNKLKMLENKLEEKADSLDKA